MIFYINNRDGRPGPKGPGMIPRIPNQKEIAFYQDCLELLKYSCAEEELPYEAWAQAIDMARRNCDFFK